MAEPGVISFNRSENFSSLVAEEGARMRKDRTFTDFQISIDEECFPCHKYVVSLHSQYLKAILTSDMVEAAKQSINFNHISSMIMMAVLDYMYTGQISFHADSLMDMIRACHHLQMEELLGRCVDEVTSVLVPTNAISWLKLGNQLELGDVISKAKHTMVSNFRVVSNQPEFLGLSHAEVLDYIRDVVRSDDNRDDILHAVMRWVSHDSDIRHTHLEGLLKMIQPERCTLPAVLNVLKTYGATIKTSDITVLNLLTDAMKTISAVTTPQMVIIGGQVDEGVSPICWCLNNAKQFVELGDITCDLAKRHSVCKTPQGFVITGGEDSDLCIMFTTSTKSWSKLPNMLEKRRRHGSIWIKGKLYVLGGGKDYGSSVHFLVLKDGEWQSGSELPISVMWPRVAGINDSVYLLDAWDTKQLLQLDARTGVWTKRASLPVKDECRGASMISLNGQLVVAGGQNKICAWYHPATNTWSMGQKPRYRHYYGSMVCLDNKLILLGGRQNKKDEGTNEIEECNIEDGSWSFSTIKMPASLRFHQALMLEIPQED